MLFESFVKRLNESNEVEGLLLTIDPEKFYSDSIKKVNSWKPSNSFIEEYSKKQNLEHKQYARPNFSVQPTYYDVSPAAVYYLDSLLALEDSLDRPLSLSKSASISTKKNFFTSLETNQRRIHNSKYELETDAFLTNELNILPPYVINAFPFTRNELISLFRSLVKTIITYAKYIVVIPKVNEYEKEKYIPSAIENFEKALENPNLDLKSRKLYQKILDFLKSGGYTGHWKDRLNEVRDSQEYAKKYIKEIKDLQEKLK